MPSISKKNHKKSNHDRIIHYFDHKQKNTGYSIRIHHNKSLIGFGDGLNNIILSYTNQKMFPKQNVFDNIITDQRPQKIIAELSNYNNLKSSLYPDESHTNNDLDCTRNILLRRNLQLQKLHSNYVFNYFSKIIETDLYISLLCEIKRLDNTNNSLFNILPEDIIINIIQFLQKSHLFDF